MTPAYPDSVLVGNGQHRVRRPRFAAIHKRRAPRALTDEDIEFALLGLGPRPNVVGAPARPRGLPNGIMAVSSSQTKARFSRSAKSVSVAVAQVQLS
jgi:hypothetical protein